MFTSRNSTPQLRSATSAADEADHRGHAAEHQRLGEQLHDDPAAARAERAPHDELALARRGPREQQQGDVAADEHEQHAARRRRSRRRCRRPRPTGREKNSLAYGVTRGCRCSCVAGCSIAARAAERGQLRLRRLEGRAGREQAEDGDAGARTRRLVQHLHPQRHPQLVRDRELEAFPHHADDRRVLVAELHAAAEHIGIAAEARAPHVVAEHGDRLAHRPARRPATRTRPRSGARAGDAEAGRGDLRDLRRDAHRRRRRSGCA